MVKECEVLVSGIFSRPTYEPLAIDPAGRSHLVVADHVFAPDAAFLSTLPTSAPVEIWSVIGDSRVSQDPLSDSPATTRSFRATAQLLDAVEHRLSRERVGFRLYAIGLEAFVWDVAKLARAIGLDKGEYRLTHAGSERRRVYCVHCRTFTENVVTNIVSCSGCGAHLLVRDHFSQRLAAFMGVQADAEIPDELPRIEEAFL
jgi:dimethylamine monooxygenase subunit C